MLQNFSDEKILKYLILGLFVIVIGLLVKEFFLPRAQAPVSILSSQDAPIKIDFEFLKTGQVGELTLVPDLTLPADYGRLNPFEPY